MAGHCGQTVLGGAGAQTAGDDLAPVLTVGGFAAAGVGLQVGTVTEVVVVAAGVGHDLGGNGLGHGAHDQVYQDVVGNHTLEAAVGGLAVDQSAFGSDDLNGTLTAAVGGDVGVGDATHGVISSGSGSGQGRVDGAAQLFVSAGVVKLDVIALDANGQLDGVGAAGKAVVQDLLFVSVLAVGDLSDLGTGQTLGIVHQSFGNFADGLHAVLVDDLAEVLDADVTGGDLSHQVALHIAGSTGVVQDNAPQGLVADALVIQLDGLHQEAFLPDFHGPGVAGPDTAHVLVVQHGHGEADQFLILIEDGGDHDQVLGVVRTQGFAAGIRMVGQDDITGMHLLSGEELGQNGVQTGTQAVQVDGHVGALGQHPALVIKDGGGTVHHFLNDGGICASHHGNSHLFSNASQGVVDDFQQNRIGHSFLLLTSYLHWYT